MHHPCKFGEDRTSRDLDRGVALNIPGTDPDANLRGIAYASMDFDSAKYVKRMSSLNTVISSLFKAKNLLFKV